MPTLDWIGKDKVINHHNDVPYKVLERKYSYDEDGEHKDDIYSENMIIHGDNLEALKSLLPQYEGKIKCIYIDPPYNTRKSSEKNKAWIYSDSVDDPKIEKWLGVTVGDEGEDLSRHDKWLCMMYPRLVLLNKLLSDKGIVFISIDDNECSYLKIICDDIFGKKNFVAQLIWRSDGNFDNQAKIKNVHEYILCYIKNADEVGLPQAIDPSASENSKIYNEEVRNTVVKNGPKNPMSTIKLPIGFPCSVSDLIIKSRKDKFPYYGADAIIEGGRLINEVEVESGWSSKNILIKYAAGFTSKDYRIDDYVEQDTEFSVEQAGNIQTELKLDNDVTDDTNNVSDEIDSLNIDFVREQISPFVNNDNMESQSQSEVNDVVTDMLDHAKTQNELYWQDFEETEEYLPVPPEVGNKMKHYKVNQLYASEAGQIEIPQFMIETGRSLFSEHEHQVLTKENLYAGFSLLDKDTVIDFDSIDSEIARIDIDDSDAMPKAWKLQGFDSQNVKQWFDEQPSDRKMRLCKDMIIKKLSKNNAINDRDLEVYVDRIIQNLTEDQLTDMEQTPGIYVLKINKKVNSLLNEYAKKMFFEWVEQDKISCQSSYKLPKEISPTETIASIPKSLYNEEEKFDTEYERKVVMELSSLNNIKWWHRNMARKGFAINGAVNAYPDLMVRTESGKLLLIETKGDQLENSESREKAEIGAKWAEMAGRMYKYYMVFETKNPGYNGAYSYEEFMRIVKEL